jgi:hypothetical protein
VHTTFTDGRDDVSCADADILGSTDRRGVGNGANEKVDSELGGFPDIKHQPIGATGPKRLGGGARNRVDIDLSLIIVNQSIGHNVLWQVCILREGDTLGFVKADSQNAKLKPLDFDRIIGDCIQDKTISKAMSC